MTKLQSVNRFLDGVLAILGCIILIIIIAGLLTWSVNQITVQNEPTSEELLKPISGNTRTFVSTYNIYENTPHRFTYFFVHLKPGEEATFETIDEEFNYFCQGELICNFLCWKIAEYPKQCITMVEAFTLLKQHITESAE